MPRPHFTPGKELAPILQEAGWALGPVWTGRKSRPHWDSILDHPARSSVAILTELPGPHSSLLDIENQHKLCLMPSNSQPYVFPLVVSAPGLLISETKMATKSVACDENFLC